MKNTPFIDFHLALGAKMHEFAGYNMPIEYTSVNSEHLQVRNSVGVFDVSHMGEIWIKGKNAFDFVQKTTTNDIQKLLVGDVQYSCFPSEKGGIVDDLLVYKYDDNKYLLVVNASNTDKDYKWLLEQNDVGVEIENASEATAQLAVQGPNALNVMQKLTDTDLSTLGFFKFITITLKDIGEVILSTTGYTGSGGFEIYCYNADAKKLWNAVFEAGEEFGIQAIGLAARDTLRLEKGFCLYGNDIDETSSPIEASLGWITKFVDGNNFINRAALEQEAKTGAKRKLKGFVMIDRGIPRKGYEIVNKEGDQIGIVTSGTMSPSLKKGIGMGYVNSNYSAIDSDIYIKVRKKLLKAVVTKLPFVK